MKTNEIVIAGFGGQGLLFSGKVLAYAGLLENRELSWLPSYGPEYLERVTVNSVPRVRAAKKAIKKAFQNQIDGKGFSLVEVVSSCPTNWGLTPQKALEFIDEKMLPQYPLGCFRDKEANI